MATLPSGLPEDIADADDVARFLMQSNHFTADMLKVKPAAFLPSPTGWESSVSRHGREPADALRALGRGAAGERRLYGAAFVTAGDVRRAQLEVQADEPPDRHAAIRGWPPDVGDGMIQKAQRKQFALILAEAAGKPVMF